MKARRHDVDMTQGSVFRHILMFALPLLAGNLFQQLYNTVDAWVVGHYVSIQAFSAVGSVNPIVNIMINGFSGLASGAGVVVAQHYGAKDFKNVSRAVHTSILLTLILSVVLSIIGVAMTPTMLRFMKTPADVFPEAQTYLTIYFAGMAGLLFYNMGAGILRAVGDSRRPFYFLVTTVFTNIGLDLLFVIRFNMGVAGVAYATIIAQALSAALTLITLFRTTSCVRLSLRSMRLHLDMLKTVIRIGLPAALQMSINAFSNVFVLSYINQFGTSCMGGWATYQKIDQFLLLPMNSIGMACGTFVGQNLGAGLDDRAHKGVRTSLVMSLVITGAISATILLTSPYLAVVFSDDPGAAEYAALFLSYIPLFHVLATGNMVYTNALRGAGNSRAPMVIMLVTFVAFRQTYLFIMSNFIANEIVPLTMAFPAGWILGSVVSMTYYHWFRKQNRSNLVIAAPAKPEKEQ